MPTCKYWNTDLDKPLKWIAPPVWDNGAGYAISEAENGILTVRDITDGFKASAVNVEDAGDGYVKLRFESGKYLGIAVLNDKNGSHTVAVADDIGCRWRLDRFAQDRYKIRSEDGRALSNDRQNRRLELVENGFSTTQIFRFVLA